MKNNEKLVEVSVAKLFEEVEYEIPIYQRNYAWKAEHIEQLINDISDIGDSQNYYIGSLIVNQKGLNVYEVIDGQQRLTTLFLIHKYLYKQKMDNVLKFEAREVANDTLKNIGIEVDEKFQVAEIIDGYKVIKNMFENTEIKKEEFIKKLENVSIIRVQVPENTDLNHYFEIMNTRGEQLELHEIGKAKILSALSKNEDKEVGAMIWDACSKMNTYIQMNVSKTKRGLIFGNDWNEFKPFDFDDIVKKMRVDDKSENTYKVEKRTLIDILNNGTINLTKKENSETEENNRFEPIINFPNFILQVNKVVSECDNLDDKRFIENIKIHYENEENAKKFLYNLLKYRFLFDKFILKREYAKEYKEEGRWSLQQLKKYRDVKSDKPLYFATFNIDELNKQIRTIQSCFRITYTSPKVMHWIYIMLKELSFDIDAKTLLKNLEQYGIGEVIDARYKEKEGFYLPRIVYSYLDYILYRDGFENFVELDRKDFYFQFRNSIEHFYPQNPVEGVKWDKEDLHDFGNLALITTSGNSKFSNISPEGKITTHPSVVKQSLKLAVMNSLMKNNNRWTKELVKEHRNDMIKILDIECNKMIEKL